MVLQSESDTIQPDTYLITPDWPVERLRDFLLWALDTGIDLIQLRCFSQSCEQIAALVTWLKGQHGDIRILLNSGLPGSRQLAQEFDCGIHWRSRDMLKVGDDIPRRCAPCAASCHNLQELKAAEQAGMDFAVLSPVCQTTSHPDSAPIGWNLFRKWVEMSEIPIYALGGMKFEDINRARNAGAAGLAGIGLFVQRYMRLSTSRSSSSTLSGGTGTE
ncbi:MAG: hypothetical protein D6698_13930 [Gammaproteobacteria bacterium]|nr:MAG: hypothetical protein D6698_13930 [Gammaproteobacteria bacterium]